MVSLRLVTEVRQLTAGERARVFKALSDPRRVEIIDRLARGGAMCGTDLADALGISLALLCHHSEVLADAGILRKERVGKLRVCTLDLERVRQATGGWSAKSPRGRPGAGTRPTLGVPAVGRKRRVRRRRTAVSPA